MNKEIIAAVALAAVMALASTSAIAAEDVKKGKKVFNKCNICLMKNIILITLLSLTIPIKASWGFPSDFNAVYDAKIKQAKGQLTSELITNEDGTYSYEMTTNATGVWKILANGMISEKSIFKKENNRLIPIKYILNNSIKGFKSEVNFDFKNNRIDGYYKERIIDLIFEEEMIDRVLLQLDIINSVKENHSLTTLKVLDKDKIEKVEVERTLEVETITVPFGEFVCIKVRHSKVDSDKENILWLAKELNFIHIKLIHLIL